MSKSEIEVLKAALIGRLSFLVHTLYSDRAVWQGHEWRVGSVRGEPGSSMAIEGKDPARLGLWHDHNPAAQERGGDVLNLIAGALGIDFKGALAWAERFLGSSGSQPLSVAPTVAKPGNSTGITVRTGEPLAEADARSLRQAAAALQRHKGAMAQLRKRGLELATIQHFHLALYSYVGTQGGVMNALSYPVLDDEGKARKRYLRSRLDRVTVGGPDAKDWAAGKPGTYWVTPREGRKELFICEGAKDGWWLWQALQHSPLQGRLCIITSTHGSGIPDPWHDPVFWQGWERVYLAQDNDEAGEALAQRVREVAGRDVHRVRVPQDYGKDWTDFFRSGQTAADIAVLLEHAPVFSLEVEQLPTATLPPSTGHHLVAPREVGRTYANGHLYLPFRALEQTEGEDYGNHISEKVQRYRTLVLRSDGQVLSIHTLPASRGTPKQDRVLALSDGTLISRQPTRHEAENGLSPGAVARYREARRSQRSALSLSPTDLVEALSNTLRASVVLARPEDHALLVLLLFASPARAAFDKFPQVRIQGPAREELHALLERLDGDPSIAEPDSALEGSSHALVIYTRGSVPLPTLQSSTPLPSPQALQNDLRLWVFENVSRIERAMQKRTDGDVSPQEALSVPLRVVADLLGLPSLRDQVRAALALQEQPLVIPSTPSDLLQQAVRSLVRQGYNHKIALVHLQLELQFLERSGATGELLQTQPVWREARWIGKTLRAYQLLDPREPATRPRLWGVQTRIVTLAPSFVGAVQQELIERDEAFVLQTRQSLAFCLAKPCSECPYQDFCFMRSQKEKARFVTTVRQTQNPIQSLLID